MVKVRPRCNRLLACFAVAVAIIALFALTSCGGRSLVRSLADSVENSVRLTAEETGVLPFPMPSPENNFRTDGLTPGEDYYPDRFVVSFKRGAKGSSTAPQVTDYNADSVLYRNTGTIPLARQIRDAYGLETYAEAYCGSVNFAAYQMPNGKDARSMMEQVLTDYSEQIVCVEYDLIVYPSAYNPNDPYFTNGVLWGMTKINADDAWDVTRGDSGTLVAVIDSGIRYSSETGHPDHQDLAANTLHPPDYWPSENFDRIDHDNFPKDGFGHGTHVSGTIAAVGNNGAGVIGVAPEVSIVPLRVFGDDATGSPQTLVAESVILADEAAHVDVINMSLGSDEGVIFPLYYALVDADNHGIFLVAAAGNKEPPTSTPEYPAALDMVLAVGATNRNDDRASYSKFGSWVDIAAPGGDYYNPPPEQWENMIASCGYETINQYLWMQGTSMAAPHVAGAAALLRSYAPSLTNAEIWNALVNNGPVLDAGQWGRSGLHRLDVYAALASISYPVVHLPQPSPLVATDTLRIEPDVVTNVDSLQYYVNEEPAATRTGAPWGIEVDSSDVEYGTVRVRVIATRDLPYLVSDEEFPYAVDNTGGVYPFINHFESQSEALATWSNSSEGHFQRISGGYSSGYSFGVHNSEYPDYPNNLTTMAVTPLLSLPASPPNPTPTMTVRMHYNLEQGADIASIYISTDYFQDDWTLLKQRNSSDARVSGFQEDWVSMQIAISDWAGQNVHIGFLLQTDSDGVGQTGSKPAGWWLDQVVIAKSWAESVPFITVTGLPDPAYVGVVLNEPNLSLAAGAVNDPVSLAYTLHTVDGDITGEVSGPPFEKDIDVSLLLNQQALLELQAFDDRGIGSPLVEVPVWIFNLSGDMNGDGTVNDDDRDALSGVLGVRSSEPSFMPWYDSNGNGIIDEADLAAVGYFWGSSM